VPANRIGSYEFSAVQLKTIQEVITLVVFSVFSVLNLGQSIRWNHVAGSAMIVGGRGTDLQAVVTPTGSVVPLLFALGNPYLIPTRRVITLQDASRS
jgi:hypothetical protein